MRPLHDLEIPLLVMCPKELKSGSQRDNEIPRFSVALFITAERWKQPKCLLADKWIKKTWDIHRVECYIRFIKKEILPYVTAPPKLDDIVFSEISRSQENKCCVIPLMQSIQRVK